LPHTDAAEARGNFHRATAEYIWLAQESGATQQRIALHLHKSIGWVNGLLKWRESGYKERTPFGSSSKAARQRRFQAIEEHTKQGPEPLIAPEITATEANPCDSKSGGDKETPDDSSRRSFTHRERARLLDALKWLGTCPIHQRTHAVHTVEALRRHLQMSWNDLIVPAQNVN
jgi:hypothetical protein